MRFTVTTEIAAPRARVLELLTEPEHRPAWLRGLVSHEPVHGEDGHVGTVSRVVFATGGRTMESTETITRREPTDLGDVPPDEVVHFERELAAEGMWSAARERLVATGPTTTRWESENEYRFTGAMRVIAPLMRGAFVRQTRAHMADFVAFAEHGTDVRG